MAKIIELPDGSEAEFPDDMHDDAIGEVLRKQFAPAPKRQPDSFMSRVGTGLMDPIVGAGQIMDKVLVNPIRQTLFPGASSMSDVVRSRDAEYNAPEGIDAARMAGNLLNPVTWAGGGAGPLRAAVAGGMQGALSPVAADADFAAEKAQQAGTGAALGGVLAKALRGFTPTAEARSLMDQGIQPTVGQSLGGVANRMEQKATSVPFVGDAINYARNRAQNEFQQKVIERATQGGAKGLDEANAYASQLYQEVVPHLKPTKEAVTGIQQAVRNAMQNPEMIDQSKAILTGLVEKHGQNFGTLSGEGLKKLDSELGFLARKYQAGDPASKTLADEIYNVQAALRTGLESGLPAELQGKLQTANAVWKDLIPINKAASARTDEKVMPRALQKAVARQQRTDVTRMKPDDLIDNAVAVLPSTVPDSGTAGRVMLGGGGLAGGLLPQMLGVGIPAAIGATRTGQRAAMGNTKLQRMLQPYDDQLAATTIAALRGRKRDGE